MDQMNSSSIHIFSPREATILDLPLVANAELSHPQNTMIRVAGRIHDIGSYCYALRSPAMRKPKAACDVVLTSFMKERVSQVKALIKALAKLLTDGGLRERSIDGHCSALRDFLTWTDSHGHTDCLAGGDATRSAYGAYVQSVEDRYRRHEIGCTYGFHRQKHVRTVLESLTGQDDLGKGIRMIRNSDKASRVTEPASAQDFARALSLNDAMFRGLSDLVLDSKPFPYQLLLPECLGWQKSYLWLFPAPRWFKHPASNTASTEMNRLYDYENGCLASEDDIWLRYQGKTEDEKRWWARFQLAQTNANVARANSDIRGYYRLMMASIAHDAFFFLFLANTGGNQQTVIDIETDGLLSETAVNQGYRSIKWRASGKVVNLVVPMAFMASLRRFMELRRYLLNGTDCPYLFINRGKTRSAMPSKVDATTIHKMYTLLRRIDPGLPLIAAKKIRATVSDYYQREHDVAVTAAVLQNSEATALKNYNAGSATDHQVEMSLVLKKIAAKAQTHVVRQSAVPADCRPLEEGGVCPAHSNPESLSACAPVAPNCKTGCLFCANRLLVAGEDDTRKVASAAFLMERLVVGPQSEAEYRPQIVKCDEDLAALRAFDGCAGMVDRVKADVYENGNLTPYFADKYQLFLNLGVL